MNDLEQRVEKLEEEMRLLQHELEMIRTERPEEPVLRATTSPGKVMGIPRGTIARRPKGAPLKRSVASSIKERAQGKTAEQFIGKTAMGVGASVLIFIAMVMFATLIIPAFNDTMKMLSMYALSAALIVAGEFIYKKSRTGYMILSACGVGALFISFVATCVYFRVIGQTVLYILLLLWVFGVAFHLARNRNTMFVVVGQIGIVISVLLSAYGSSEPAAVYLMIAFILLAEALFFICFFRKTFWIDCINVCGTVLSFVILDGIVYSLPSASGTIAAVAVCCIFSMVGSLAYLYSRKLTETEGFAVRICSLASCLLFVPVAGSLQHIPGLSSDMPGLASALYGASLMFAGDMFGGRRHLTATRYLHLGFCICCALSITCPYENMALFILMLLSFCFGLYRKDRTCYFMLPVLYAVMIADVFSAPSQALPMILFLLGFVVLLLQIVLVRITDGVFFPYEVTAYVLVMLGITRCFGAVSAFARQGDPAAMPYSALWAVFVMAVVQIVIKRARWCSASRTPFYLMNGLLMTAALVNCRLYVGDGIDLFFSTHIGGHGELFPAVLAVVTAVIVFSINVTELWGQSPLAGAYIAFKYSVLLIVILCSLDVPNQVMSVVFLLVAAVSVGTGFWFRSKSLRLYGLILSMIAIAKLILVDTSYEHSLTRAFSFLICGLICFAVSIVYNRMERKMAAEKTENSAEG